MGENGHYQLIAALRPFVHEEESRIESFLEEDLEWFVEAIEAFGVEDLMMQYIKRNPNATTQELYHYFLIILATARQGRKIFGKTTRGNKHGERRLLCVSQ